MSANTRKAIPYSMSNSGSPPKQQESYSTNPMRPMSSTQQLGNTQKFSRTVKKGPTGGRNEKIDPDLYYAVREENEQLKKAQLEVNKKLKETQVAMAQIRSNIIKERKLADRKVVTLDGGYDVELEAAKLENEKLRSQNKNLRTYIDGLQSDKRGLINKTRKKGFRNPLQAQKEKNESLALIAHLREELKIAQEDRRNLVNELTKLQHGTTKKAFHGDKTSSDFGASMADMKTRYDDANIKLDTNNKILQMTKKSLQEYIERYQQETERNSQLQSRIQILEDENEKLNEKQALIDEYKKREKILEQRIEDLCESPFLKQAEERGNIFKKFQENEKALTEAERLIRELEEKVRTLERDNKNLKNNLDIATVDKDRFKEEAMRLKISNEEKEKNSKAFQDQLSLLSQYGEVDSNFNKMMNILKIREDSNKWMNMNFLDQMTQEQKNDVNFLNKEIEKLKIEKGTLGAELERTKNILQIQQQINEDLKTVQDFDQRKYQAEIKHLKQKIEELCKLVDIERLPKEYVVKDPATNKTILRDRNSLLNELVPDRDGAMALNASITEFSRDDNEPEFSMNENALDIYFGECDFEDGLEKELGFKMENMMSFISVDFFIHETQTSNLVSGKIPMFNLQLSFRVNVDEHFLNYLESDYITVEIYYLRDNIQVIFGRGRIPLNDLIAAESNKNKTNTRVINNIVTIYFAKDENLKVASIHYKMRMRSPLSEVLKWYHEKNKFIREVNPVHNVLVTNAEKTFEQYAYTGGKVYEVKILITKANRLVVTGPPRKILPYFYYKFYKDNERYSNISSGNDPQFQDVASFPVIYDPAFHDYIEKETLDVYLFDSSDPIEVDVSNKDAVRLVDQETMDLIGICKIPLKGLLIANLIQGNFPIFNNKGKDCGELVINIFWEEVVKPRDDANQGQPKTTIPYEMKAFEDELVIRLADCLKAKGLNLTSAFEIFDMDKKGEISLSNFQDTLWYTLKFTNNQQEMNHLKNIFFPNSSTTLTKTEFFKIFAMLLPHEGPAEGIISNRPDSSQKSKEQPPNMIVNSDMMKFSITQSQQKTPQPQQGGLGESIPDVRESQNVAQSSVVNPGKMFGIQMGNSNRSGDELFDSFHEYQLRTGKKEAVDIFKMFDTDASLKVDQKEFLKGVSKMNIQLSMSEFQILWKEITGATLERIPSFSYREFKNFFDNRMKKFEENKGDKSYQRKIASTGTVPEFNETQNNPSGFYGKSGGYGGYSGSLNMQRFGGSNMSQSIPYN